MFLNKSILYTCALCLFTFGCSGPATEKEAVIQVPLTETHNLNPVFWDYAVSSNMLQVELGKLAAEKGSNEQIKQWGKEAQTYHQKALQSLKAIGQGHGAIVLPDSLGTADKGMVTEFAALTGNAFDTRYREHLIISHKAQLERYSEALQTADGAALKDLLTDMQQHLRSRLEEVTKADSVQLVKAAE